MDRRGFIATACLACLGGGSLPALLSSCAADDIITGDVADGKIRIPLPLPGTGPVRIVRAAGFPDAIALVSGAGGEIHALILRCTHADNPLTPGPGGYTCSLHGSRFDIEGRVTRGPATRPLRTLMTTVSGESLSIVIAK